MSTQFTNGTTRGWVISEWIHREAKIKTQYKIPLRYHLRIPYLGKITQCFVTLPYVTLKHDCTRTGRYCMGPKPRNLGGRGSCAASRGEGKYEGGGGGVTVG